jgi:DNA replication ATP-dependent helicase Dna2
VPAGLLYYSQLDTVLRVEAKTNEIRSLIMARNELASYLHKKRKLIQQPKTDGSAKTSANEPSQRFVDEGICDIEDAFLPPTIDNEKECQNCYAKDACMLYRKVSFHVCEIVRFMQKS